MGLILFYGIISLLPLFFLYQIYRDIEKKKASRRQLTRFFKSSGGENGKLEDAVKLVDDLDSIFPWVRPAAINSLVKDDTKGVQTIMTVLDVPYYRSWISGFVLTQPDFNGTIIFDIYPFLIKALVEIGRSSVGKLNAALQHPNLNVRLSAMAALGETKNPSAIRLLAPFLDSSDAEERIGAMFALGELRATAAIEKIIASLRDGNPYVREMGIRALIRINDVRAIPALENLVLDSTDVEERISALVVLGELHATSAVEKIITSLGDGNPRVREIGIRALIKINDVRAIPALENLARSDQTVIDDRPIYTMKDLAEDAIKRIRKNNRIR